MQWLSLTDFFNMGGYAFYVWSSFGLTALVAAIEIGHVRACRRKILRQQGCDSSSFDSLGRVTNRYPYPLTELTVTHPSV